MAAAEPPPPPLIETESNKSSDLKELLKSFYERAALAEVYYRVSTVLLIQGGGDERLSKLEAFVAGKKDPSVEDVPSFVKDFQLKLHTSDTEAISDQMASRELQALAERNTKLAAGNVKLTTGITNLVEEHVNLAATHAKKTEETVKLSEEIAKLVAENTKLAAESAKLEAANVKLQYQVTHLVRALKEADRKLESK